MIPEQLHEVMVPRVCADKTVNFLQPSLQVLLIAEKKVGAVKKAEYPTRFPDYF